VKAGKKKIKKLKRGGEKGNMYITGGGGSTLEGEGQFGKMEEG